VNAKGESTMKHIISAGLLFAAAAAFATHAADVSPDEERYVSIQS